MLHKRKTPYLRDVYLAYLIDGARRTETDGFPIIEKWMVIEEPPKQMVQWNRRKDVINPKETAICFYCNDEYLQGILGNPKRYWEKMRIYDCIVGMDASSYDNMPLYIQKSQIGLNLGITYYYGKLGAKILPNVRLGSNSTLTSLEAYPHNTLIAIGTNGFVKQLENRIVFADQLMKVVDTLEPSGICVYGPIPDELFSYVNLKGIPVYQYDSYTMKENKKDRQNRLLEDRKHEG